MTFRIMNFEDDVTPIFGPEKHTTTQHLPQHIRNCSSIHAWKALSLDDPSRGLVIVRIRLFVNLSKAPQQLHWSEEHES